MSNKKYYFLKLSEDFFQQTELKKLRKLPGGDTYTIIYQKMMLLSLKTEGKIIFENIDDNLVKELSIKLDESLSNMIETLNFLKSLKLIKEILSTNIELLKIKDSIISETPQAEIMRLYRAKKNLHIPTKKIC